MTLNPGHFHTALVQKTMLPGVDSTVYIYAPEGDDLRLHLDRIESYNTREENPTSWNTEIITGPDYLETMMEERPGNVMVTAGNNRLKTTYIERAVSEGIHVLSDKPMAIDREGWELLVDAFDEAENNDALLLDIMTERHEVTTRLQRRLSQNSELFGELIDGSPENPAIVKESIHHLYKMVSGSPLRRPAWYFDTDQQGEGIVDVTTHLVDLTLWGTFPGEAIRYESDIEITGARRWATELTLQQFENITGEPQFPDYLEEDVKEGVLEYYSNGEIHFNLRGHHAKVSVQWNYQAPEGGGDSHYSLMRGSRATLFIRSGAEQDFKSTLYVEPTYDVGLDETEEVLSGIIDELQPEFSGIRYSRYDSGFRIHIPDEYHLGHEAHFGVVAQNFLSYLEAGALPEWEVPNMITKYYITTQAREIAMENDMANE
jgi:predicted dehydrogenase